ncbi:hypothetical protein [Mycolicibacterium wolinskyi]|uniref:hypothetical protein n=1 Tax=Mycolicibacterium wolinskyi TaxID=59750 RepID=UPI0039177F84
MKDEQGSGQTVREILQNHSYVQRYALKLIPAADKQHMNGYEVAEAANDIRLNNQMETEAAINAHIVSVLEELKEQQWTFGPDNDALAVPTRYIDAVIERHSDGS